MPCTNLLEFGHVLEETWQKNLAEVMVLCNQFVQMLTKICNGRPYEISERQSVRDGWANSNTRSETDKRWQDPFVKEDVENNSDKRQKRKHATVQTVECDEKPSRKHPQRRRAGTGKQRRLRWPNRTSRRQWSPTKDASSTSPEIREVSTRRSGTQEMQEYTNPQIHQLSAVN